MSDPHNGQVTLAKHSCGAAMIFFEGGLYCVACEEPSVTSPPSVPYVAQDTSQQAAHFQSSSGKASTDEMRVLTFIRNKGGATDDEVEVALDLPHQTASARRNGLAKKGLVVQTAGRRDTRRGRKAIVWRATTHQEQTR